ncbi:hypothetical protein BDN70DRAFT_867029 [Pholiota conissans]|uniref:Uncharacterized protein n=1 Tax=Pholiota conissans TaxID=109636 RepID=A0A9P5YQ63_9AGAR|nr:hypothetical protein BDN70DRAFT_867029 [Pholiota conissans]
MKFTAIYTILGLALAAAAIPSHYEPRAISNDIQSREFDMEDYQERSDMYEDSVQERDYDDDNYLGARYLDSNYELSEREFLEMERRGGAGAIAKVLVKGIEAIVNAIKGAIQQDKDMRGRWTSALVQKLHNKNPHFNWVVCHTQHKYNFKGVKGKDWGHSHHEISVHFSKTVGFEIYWFKEGTFDRIGDGGYLNWAYYGNVKSQSSDKKHTVFGPM